MLKFDGANGVGALKMRAMLPFLGDSIAVEVFNDGSGADDKLNHECGADYVKVQQGSPRGMEGCVDVRCVSVDGDADRVMFFFNDAKGFNMLDGDKIATLGKLHLRD